MTDSKKRPQKKASRAKKGKAKNKAVKKTAAPKRPPKLSKVDILTNQYLRLEQHDEINAARRGWTGGTPVERADRRIQLMKQRTLEKLDAAQRAESKPVLSKVKGAIGKKTPHLSNQAIKMFVNYDMRGSGGTTSYQDARAHWNQRTKVERSGRARAATKIGKAVGLEKQAQKMVQGWSDAHALKADIKFDAETSAKRNPHNPRIQRHAAGIRRAARVAQAARVVPWLGPAVGVGVAGYELANGKSLSQAAYAGADVMTANSLSEYNYLRDRGYNQVASGALAAANFVTMGLFGQSGYTAEERAAQARMSRSMNDLRRKNRRRQNAKRAAPKTSAGNQGQDPQSSGNRKRGTQNKANLKAIIKSRRRNARGRTQRGTR